MKLKDTFSQTTSILTKRLTAKVIRNYIITFLILLILLIIILCPILIRNNLNRQNEYASMIADQYEQTLTSIQTTTRSLMNNTDLAHLLKVYEQKPTSATKFKIDMHLQSFLSTFSKVKYCMLETEDGDIFEAFTNSSTNAQIIATQSSAYQAILNKSTYTYYSQVLPYDLFNRDGAMSSCHSIYTLRNLTLAGHSYIFTVFYNIDDCINNSKSLQQDTFSDYLVLNQNKESVYTSFTKETTIPDKIIKTTTYQFGKPIYTSDRVYFNEKISTVGWVICTYASWSLLLSSFYLSLSIVLLFYILPPILFYINVVPTNKKFLQPLSTLTHQISHFSAGQDLVLDIHTGDEIEQLSNSINKMIQNINAQIDDIKRKEHENAITHYSLLATQIDPHFIYNTLNIINIMARQTGQNSIVDVNTALSKILRERFSTKSSIFETIENGLDTIRQYYTIMKYRYQNKVKINISAETHIIFEKIPKNLLIPIIENSYYHGLTKDNGIIQGKIDITIYSIENDIIIEISDDGTGISNDKIDYLKKHNFQTTEQDRTHIGLSNIYERLHYIYHENFSIDMNSTIGFGTTFSITIPKYDPSYEFANLPYNT
jgi:two-component system, sensor histidine kinase YesM